MDKEQVFELQIYDPEHEKTYSINLNEKDYQRALTDYTFSQALLTSLQNDVIDDNMSNTFVPLSKSEEQITASTPGTLLPSSESEEQITASTPGSSTISSASQRWEREATMTLIKLYKENDQKFKSTTVKNEHVWKLMAEKMKEQGYKYNKTQLENKFKYLKARYIRKKENQGRKGTGESPVFFEYFEEFDDIFGDKPNIKPKSLAASIPLAVSEESVDGEPPKKKTKTRLDKEISLLTTLFETNNKKKEETERRHRERQELTTQAITVYEKMMQKLIDKL